MPCCAITSERLCAGHPSARAPRTAPQNAGSGFELQLASDGAVCAHPVDPANISPSPKAAAEVLNFFIASLPLRRLSLPRNALRKLSVPRQIQPERKSRLLSGLLRLQVDGFWEALKNLDNVDKSSHIGASVNDYQSVTVHQRGEMSPLRNQWPQDWNQLCSGDIFYRHDAGDPLVIERLYVLGRYQG
jgi:hypothetical protein